MEPFWQHVRTGDWLTAERRRIYALIVLGLVAVVSVAWVAMSHGMVDRMGSPIGTDFTNVYAAGIQTLQGTAAGAYDPATQHTAEQTIFAGRDVPFYGWHYPPFFLIVAAGLAMLPYGWALLAWMAVTLPAYAAVVRAIVPRGETVLLALAFPAVFVNLGHGQNGFLTAALLGGALLVLDRRPIVAGILIGLLAYKPQFGILIPLVLLATLRWTVIAAAVATVAVEIAATFVLFGRDVWTAFAGSAAFTREVVLEAGGTGWQKIQSIFSAVRSWGGTVEMAYAAQAVLALALAASLIWLWRSRADFNLKAAALALACLLATPYVLDYDLVVVAVAIAFLVRHGLAEGFRDYEISALAAGWVAPLVTRWVALHTGVPLGLIAMLALYAIVLRRAAADLVTDRREHRLASA